LGGDGLPTQDQIDKVLAMLSDPAYAVDIDPDDDLDEPKIDAGAPGAIEPVAMSTDPLIDVAASDHTTRHASTLAEDHLARPTSAADRAGRIPSTSDHTSRLPSAAGEADHSARRPSLTGHTTHRSTTTPIQSSEPAPVESLFPATSIPTLTPHTRTRLDHRTPDAGEPTTRVDQAPAAVAPKLDTLVATSAVPTPNTPTDVSAAMKTPRTTVPNPAVASTESPATTQADESTSATTLAVSLPGQDMPELGEVVLDEVSTPETTSAADFPIDLDIPPLVEATVPTPTAGDATGLPDNRYLDRELSWLAFNTRVLDLAKDRQRIPLLERTKFLAIFSSNLDEFFMVRVAGLKRRIDAGLAQRGTSGLLPRELHEAILSTARDCTAEQSRVFMDEVIPELAEKGILLLRWPNLMASEKERLTELFRDRVFPILTPLAVDPSHPFPYISGLSLNLAVQLRNPVTSARLFARIKVPNVLPRFLEVTDGRFVPLEDVIAHHLDTIFPGMDVLKSGVFRVTRNEDVEVEEDDAENILFALEKELLRRKVGRPPVRLEVEEGIDPELLDILVNELDVTGPETFFVRGPLDLTGLFSIADADREDLKYPGFLPRTNPQLAAVETSSPADLFAAVRKRDVLLHHPYDSFATSVQRFIEQAADDPHVLAIKQTLYRTSGDSPIVDALIEAARAGKQVLALVEIKARFDEQANIAWARKLEQAGVHVVYGLVGLKTHCKLSMVIRDEGDSLRRYCHIGTGNYNPKTARMYEDMGLLTANPIITDDVARLFNHLSGMTAESHYRRLLVSPFGIRNGLLEHIDHEIELQRSGIPGRIRIKVNSIVDEATMDALYRASQAGVRVDLWVRGICALRAGVPGLSENIRVRSILGRFLEHSRLFWFDNGGHPQVGIGSADLMHRNLDRRVEVVVQLNNEAHIAKIDELFTLAFDPTIASWWLTEDGWQQKTVDQNGAALTDLQEHLIQATSTRRANP
jgi:polyphosphate kinase